MNYLVDALGDEVGSFVPKRPIDSGFGGRLGITGPTMGMLLKTSSKKGDHR